MALQTILLLLIVGLLAGTLSGLVGLGGGILIVPVLIYVMGYGQHQAQGTSLGVLLLPVGILAVINYYNKGFIDMKAVVFISMGFVLGGWLGSRMAISLPQEILKKIFAVLLFYTGLKMLGWDLAFFKWIKGIF